MSLLIDTHCHLDFDAFDADRQQVLQNARKTGVERIVNPGIDLTSSRRALELAQANPAVFAAVGIHPNDSAGWGDLALNELGLLSRQAGVVAIGEIGLDYYRDYTPRDKQAEILTAQLGLAVETGLPVILHCRRAATDLYDILCTWHDELKTSKSALSNRPGVLHAYEGTIEEARRWAEMGFLLGIGGPITYHNAAERKEVVRKIPLEWMVLETDGPFLAPQPYRGHRNEPAYISLVAEAVASIKNRSIEEVSQVTSANAGALFGWSQ